MSTQATTRTRVAPILLEVAGALVAPGAIVFLFFNWLDVYLVFFGETAVVTPEAVRSYQVAVGAGILGTVLALAGSTWRGRGAPRRTVWWHGLVALVGLAAAVVFHVGVDTPDPAPEPPPGPVCYSGSNDCPGG